MTGLPLRPVAAVVMLVFPVATAWLVFKLLREPSWRRLEMAVAGVALSLVFVAARHVWPWYVLWLLPFAVLDFTSRLGRWATGVAIAAPLLLLPWTAYPQANAFQRLELPSLVVYAFAVAWMIVAPRTWDHGSVVSAKTD